MTKKITIILIVLFLFSSVTFTQTKKVTSTIVQNKITPQHLKLKTDVLIKGIDLSQCACENELTKYNMIGSSKLWVILFNSKIKVKVQLTVTYYNLSNKKFVITKTFILNPGTKWIKIFSSPTVIKRSTGVTAEVKILEKYIKDSNPNNNKMTIKRCMNYVE